MTRIITNMIRRISIFDFDGTLKDTHDNVDPNYLSDLRFSENPEEIKAYARRSIDWLSSINSISRPEGGDPWIEPVVSAARDAIADDETLAVLMTARNPGARDLILNLLRSEVGLEFDVVLFKTNDVDPVTGKYISEEPAAWKARKTADLLQSEPDVTDVDVYEDSEENLNAIGSIIPEGVTYTPHLESTRRGQRLARKAAHKSALNDLNQKRKAFYSERGIDIGALTRSLKEWRTVGDAPLPGNFNKGAPKKNRPPHDTTYGNEPDLLDRPGVIVEPVVRKKISDYFTKMKLREFIRDCLKEI
jgi:hypothetical protein